MRLQRPKAAAAASAAKAASAAVAATTATRAEPPDISAHKTAGLPCANTVLRIQQTNWLGSTWMNSTTPSEKLADKPTSDYILTNEQTNERTNERTRKIIIFFGRKNSNIFT